MTRPLPPHLPRYTITFQPDPHGLGEWARKTFIDTGSPLTNEDHKHLREASIGWLWTGTPSEHRGRRLAGEARMPRTGGARWSQLMGVAQLEGWFGKVPDFLITIDADLATQATDDQFCALIEHELYHCGQQTGLFGEPLFTQEGRPRYAIRGHDVEQFIGVVERYGAEAAGVTQMIEAAKRGPILQDGVIPLACGTCARKAA